MSAKRRMARLKGGLLLATTAIAVLALALAVNREPGESLEVPPDDLMGVWVTDDPRYAERALVIQPDYVEFHTGEGGLAHHGILSIRGLEEADHVAFVITYRSTAGEQVLEVYLHADGILRLKNPSDVRWVREATETQG